MKPVALLLGVATLAGFGGAIYLSNYAEAPLPALFLDAVVTTKAMIFLMMPLLLLAIVLPGREPKLLVLVTVLALAMGGLASLYDIGSTMRAVAATGTTNLKIYAPSLAQGLMPIALGLLIATVAMAKPRPKAR